MSAMGRRIEGFDPVAVEWSRFGAPAAAVPEQRCPPVASIGYRGGPLPFMPPTSGAMPAPRVARNAPAIGKAALVVALVLGAAALLDLSLAGGLSRGARLFGEIGGVAGLLAALGQVSPARGG